VAQLASNWRVEALGPQHDRKSFVSSVEPLDAHLHTQFGQDARKNLAAPIVLAAPNGTTAGYCTLSSTALKLVELTEILTRKLPGMCSSRQRFSDGLPLTCGIKEKAMADFCWLISCAAQRGAKLVPLQ
jgi:hypothetical protein